MESVVCNLCGSHEAKVLHAHLPDMLLQQNGTTATLVQCCRCGLIYQNPRPTREEIKHHYPDRYDAYHYGDEQGTARRHGRLTRQAVEYGIAKRCRYVTRHKQEGTLLDVGCATGLFLQGMRKRGSWEVYGVEPSEYAAASARQSGLQVITGTLDDVTFPNHTFDVVTMWDVIEHVHDPLGTLQQVARLLKPGGLLVIRTPNYDSWDARLFGRYWSGFEPPRHLYIFTPSTIESALTKTGFVTISMDCRSGGYMVFLLSLRFRLSHSRLGPVTQRRLLTWLYHPVARLLAAPAFTLSGLGLKGPQMVVVARREEA